ncbi:unnamed protein product [[Candida] boidinii]|nr:unnamed protein product [[Candida] boidinii]
MSIILSNNSTLPLPSSNKLNNILNSDDHQDHEDHQHQDQDQPLMLEKKLFEDKHLIKPWLQSKLVHKGINIVIERSDDTKIVFKCKNTNLNGKNRRYKKRKLSKKDDSEFKQEDNNEDNYNKESSVEGEDEDGDAILKNKRSCPFRIRANFSLRAKKWSIVIVNDQHNHPLYPIISDTTSKLTENLTKKKKSFDLFNKFKYFINLIYK